MKIVESEPPTDETELVGIEERLKLSIPREYRVWLLQHNGGRPEPRVFDLLGKEGPYSDGAVGWFFSANMLEGETATYKLIQGRLPDQLFPVACDSFGNLICISTAGDDEGHVYFWDHEEEEDEPTMNNCSLIARSFAEFLDNLRPSEQDANS